MGFNSLLYLRKRHSHTLGKNCTRLVELHNFESRMDLAMSSNFVGDGTEACLSIDEVSPAQLISKRFPASMARVPSEGVHA